MSFVFLPSYRNTRLSTYESLGEVEKAMETLACSLCSHSISTCTCRFSQNFQSYFYDSIKTQYIARTDFHYKSEYQHGSKIMSESQGLVEFAFGLGDSVLHYPNRQVRFLGKIFVEIQITY